MPYNFTNSDGSITFSIPDGSVNTNSTNLNLPGPNYVGYGQRLDENLVYLLENFASNSAPAGTSLQGQLWFNKSNQTLNVFTSQGYLPTSGIIVSGSQPVNIQNGNLWFNTATNQLFVYTNISGTPTYSLVGPQYTRAQGLSGAVTVTTNDQATTGVTHNLLQLQYGNLVIATLSSDPTFYPSPAIPGFPTISPGLQFNNSLTTSVSANAFVGSLTGTVTGNVVGNLTGNVLATTLVGTLTGNVNATTVTATTLTGQLDSTQATITTANIINLLADNLTVNGGNLVGISNLSASSAQFSTAAIGTAQITGGNVTGLTNASATSAQLSNLSSGNAQITGGSLTGLSNVSATTGVLTALSASTATVGNLLTSNAQVTGGNLYNIGSITTTNLSATTLSTSGAQITGGNVTGLTNLSSTNSTISLATVANLQAASGSIANATVSNSTIASSTLVNTVTATLPIGTSNTAVATTGFVQTAMPKGIIVMWSGAASAIPTGWALCNGQTVNGSTTPDLRGQFIIGATGDTGGTYNVGTTGGNAFPSITTGQLPTHSHAYTVTGNTNSAGGHTHTVTDPGHYHGSQYDNRTPGSIDYLGSQDEIGGKGTVWTWPTTTSYTGISLVAAADHQHVINLTGNTATTGSSQPLDNRPPYYALCYIQKVF